MGLHFEESWWLLITLAAVPLGWLALRWFYSMSRARAWSGVVARLILMALLAAALAGASKVRETNRLAVVAIVDVSDSVRNFVRLEERGADIPIAATEALKDWLAQAASAREVDDLFGVVVFDGASIAVAAPRAGGGPVDDLDALTLDLRLVEGTNIEEAVRFGLSLFPPDAAGRLLLISDGNETTGDAMIAVREAMAAEGGGGAPVDVLPLAYNVQRETLIEFVDVPPVAASEAPINVRVGLRATAPTTGTLRVFYDGRPVDISRGAEGTGRRLTLAPGRRVEPVELQLAARKIHRFEAIFEPDGEDADGLDTNNMGEAVTVTPGQGSVLMVDGVSDGSPSGVGATLTNLLLQEGIEVETVAPPAMPNDLLALHEYDLIILQNVGADEVDRATQDLLSTYVTELGGGLIMIGGPDAFGAGAWQNTSVADILPVELKLPERMVAPKAAIMIVLDSSGSMGRTVLGGARTQQEIANSAAAMAIKTLDNADLVGVIAFSNFHRTVVPLAENADPIESGERILRIAPDGGTNLYPAMKAAGDALASVDAHVKHVIVLSDGESMGSPQQGFAVADSLRAQGITTSTISVGDQADVNTLREIANRGEGTFHRVIDPNVLPRIFIKEIRVVFEPFVREGLFQPTVLSSGSPVTTGLGRSWPGLTGIVLTQRRDDQPQIIVAAETPEGEPLLAHWQVGLGQVAAFTSDAHDWARSWLAWPGYRQMWTQMARVIARPPSTSSYELAADVIDGRMRLRLDVADEEARPVDLLTVDGKLYAPGSSEPSPVRLSQTGPGTYEADVEAEASGAYVVALFPKQGEKRLAPVVAGASRPRGAEHSQMRSDLSLLRRVADETGGRVFTYDAAPAPGALFDRAGIEPKRSTTPIWRLLVLWSLCVFLLDVATRRVAWDRLITREIAAEVRQHAAERLREQSERAAATVAGLREHVHLPTRHEEAEQEPTATSPRERSPAPKAERKATQVTAEQKLEQERQRKAAIREALRAQRSGARAEGPDKGKAKDEGGASETTSDLLAARRARKRREQRDDQA